MPDIFKDFLARLLSRKFLLAVAGILYFVFGVLYGALDLAVAVDGIVKIIIAYLAAEGLGDAASRFSGS